MKKIIFLILCCGLIVCSTCNKAEPPPEVPMSTVKSTSQTATEEIVVSKESGNTESKPTTEKEEIIVVTEAKPETKTEPTRTISVPEQKRKAKFRTERLI